jgi:hypothetical protein
MSLHGQYVDDSIQVKILDEYGNGGNIVDQIAFGAGGGLWGVVNFFLNFAIPFLMLYDMGMNPIVAGVINAGWWIIAPIGAVEILSGRQILQ